MLLYLDDTPGAARAADWALKLAQRLSARVYVVAVVETIPQRHGRRRSSNEEELAWQRLYEVEDDAFQSDVPVSLLLEQGAALPILQRLGSGYEVELLVIPADCRLPAAEVIQTSDRPVVFV